MTNLLPPQAKKAVKRERAMRLLSTLLLAGAALSIALMVLSIPTWYLLRVTESAINAHLPEAEAAKSTYTDLVREVGETNALVAHLNHRRQKLEPSSYVEELDRLANGPVHLSGFTFEGKTISVTGLADTRAALSAFRDRLEADTRFSAIELPLSSLVKDQDTAFTITLTLKEDL